MESNIMIERYPQNKKSKIAVRPYFDPSVENGGLENYGMALHEGIFHEESIMCLENNGIKRYITGLNEFAVEIAKLPAEEKVAKIKAIRDVVSQLERELASNVIEPDDVDFWKKVMICKPDNATFWDNIKIACSNEPLYLDMSDPYDLIKLYAIEAGGFSIVARSLEEAKNATRPYKFYLDKEERTAATVTEVKKLRNAALGELDKLFTSNSNKLLLVAKVVDINSVQYRKGTPLDVIYDNMDVFINGQGVEKDKKRSAQRFLDAAKSNMETLKLKAIVKEAAFYKMIATKADGHIYDMATHSLLGKNQADVVEYLRNPLNESILVDLTSKVESYWNQ